jgi:RNA polymerase sigma factor (sigma-70 family)
MAMKLHQRLDSEAASLWAERDVNRLLAHYTPYAERLATKRAAKQRLVDPEEYRQEALIGLWEAILSFDPGEVAAFTTWALWRINGRLIEAERANDWVKPKVRASANNGEITLPAMHRLKETFDLAVEGEGGDGLAEMFIVLMSKAKPRVVNVMQAYLDADCDEDASAAALNVKAEYFGRVLLPDAIKELREIPCRM